MKKSKADSSKIADIIFLSAAYFVTIIIIFSTYGLNTGADIKIGSVSNKTYVAAATTENTFETEKLRKAAMDETGAVYIENNDIKENALKKTKEFFESIASVENGDGQTEAETGGQAAEKDDDIILSENETELLKKSSQMRLNRLESIVETILSDAFDEGVTSREGSLTEIESRLENEDIEGEYADICFHIIDSVLEENVVVDEEATEKAKNAAADGIAPVLIQKNQKIVGENEIITEEAYHALEACGFIKQKGSFNALPFLGKCVLITLIFLGILLYFMNFNRKKILKGNEGLLLATLYIILMLATLCISPKYYAFIPIPMFLIITTLLLSTGIALICIPVVTAICMLIMSSDAEMFLYYIISGHIFVLMMCPSKDRSRGIYRGFFASVLSGVVMLGIKAMESGRPELDMFIQAGITVFVSFIYVILSVGSLSIWESLFGIVSDIRLAELINPNKELIKRLMLEAPGTYHHSLIVANLAETAAYDIGANATLARVGAYYHDIGKLNNPQYFTENIVHESPHNYIDPFTSAGIIKRHVTDGVEIAKRYKLPEIIRDIIFEHHGTGLIKYFYYEAKNNPKVTREIKEQDFRYPCRIPQFRESAIIMIADTTEAAVKSLKSSNNEEQLAHLEEFVKKIVNDKLADGQLTDSGLTIKDLTIIQKSMLGILKGMYHTRIAYPEDSKKQGQEGSE